jgi:hypothetical protein
MSSLLMHNWHRGTIKDEEDDEETRKKIHITFSNYFSLLSDARTYYHNCVDAADLQDDDDGTETRLKRFFSALTFHFSNAQCGDEGSSRGKLTKIIADVGDGDRPDINYVKCKKVVKFLRSYDCGQFRRPPKKCPSTRERRNWEREIK